LTPEKIVKAMKARKILDPSPLPSGERKQVRGK
jgi:hypothetical protein